MSQIEPTTPSPSPGIDEPQRGSSLARLRGHVIVALFVLALGWIVVGPFRPKLDLSDRLASGDGLEWKGEPVTDLSWADLRGLDLFSGEVSGGLRQLDGELVRLLGYVVPLEDDDGRPSEFLLVPYMGACIHVPPPPLNQMVHVRMKDGHRIEHDPWSWDTLHIVGRLEIASVDSPWGDVGFRMTGLGSAPATAETKRW